MKRFIRNHETISGQIDDELVMMDIEKGSYFSLNTVATRIWELLEGPLTIENLCDLLLKEYDVDYSECRADVEEHLTKMKELGLVKSID
ncbi:PqqD family protein [Spirosoma endbachense]|uniref:PqqD family peptide modification chaperone n=1 Tax=Spirosoma endbachense TaxID=2666025 RepID=A0A6P1VX59_9BACT|nr:PqqD family protein [Spirosoma endbachense]QHV96968.1 PqqD family peptide modification chaperone [Spirosoma endbachense]